jgi:DNA-binding GntR family transcriptional regulator
LLVEAGGDGSQPFRAVVHVIASSRGNRRLQNWQIGRNRSTVQYGSLLSPSMKSATASASRLQPTSDSAAQQIEQALRRAIVTLELPPGKSLSENEVALRYGVSRQPAREAMIALAKLGLVRVLPQRGTVVVKISARQMMQVRFAREALETAIVRRACERFDPMTRSSIGPMITAQRRAARDNDHATFQEHDERFHAALAAGADAELAWQTAATSCRCGPRRSDVHADHHSVNE